MYENEEDEAHSKEISLMQMQQQMRNILGDETAVLLVTFFIFFGLLERKVSETVLQGCSVNCLNNQISFCHITFAYKIRSFFRYFGYLKDWLRGRREQEEFDSYGLMLVPKNRTCLHTEFFLSFLNFCEVITQVAQKNLGKTYYLDSLF